MAKYERLAEEFRTATGCELFIDSAREPWVTLAGGSGGRVTLGVGIGMGLLVLSLYAGDEIGEWLRREFLQLKSYRMLVVAGAVGLGAAAVSFARARGASWPPGRRLAQTLRHRQLHRLALDLRCGSLTDGHR